MKTEINKLSGIFRKNTKREAIFDLTTSTSLTYGDLEIHSLQLAAFLSREGIKKGQKVGIILPNCVEYVIIYFALMQIGAIAVPLNPGLHNREIELLIQHAGVHLIFVSAGLKSRLQPVLDSLSATKQICLLLKRDQLKAHELSKGINLFEKIKTEKINFKNSFAQINDSDVISIMYTSGTTSTPKGVEIYYRNVIANGFTFLESVCMPARLRFLGVFSLAYMGGWYNLLLIPLLSEGTVILDQTFGSNTSLNFWDKVVEHHVTALWLTPTMMSILLFTGKAKQAFDYCQENIQIGLVGTAPLSPKLKKDFEKQSGIRFYENYGLSETFFISTNSVQLKQKDSSVGRLLKGCDVRVINRDQGICGVGEEGEISVKTEYLMKGYYAEDVLEEKMNQEGYFLTGDIGFMDDDGDLFITGRKKDLIIRGGLNISPKQIEDKMLEMEGIEEIACVGVPHNIYGEEVAAVVKLNEQYKNRINEKDIIEFASKNIAQAKYPRYVYFVDEFLRSTSGKIKKNQLKVMLEEKMGNP